MKAIGLTKYGGPDVLHELEQAPEELGAGQIRVRVSAAAVNPTDALLRAGARAPSDRPPGGVAVPGMDIAGVVVELGRETAAQVAVGDRVMAMVVPAGAHGGYREDLVLPARSVARAPAGVTLAQAATLPMNGLTARQALDSLGLRPGQTLAVTGAAGAVGGYLIQLAKAEDLLVVGDASQADESLVRALGADVVVRRGDDVATRIRAQFPEGVDGLADAALLGPAALTAVKDGGAVATFRGLLDGGPRGCRVTPVAVRRYSQEYEKLDQLRRLVEAGRLSLRVARELPASQAAQAHRMLEAGGTRGRLVLRFGEGRLRPLTAES